MAPKHLEPRNRSSTLGILAIAFWLAAIIGVAVLRVGTHDGTSDQTVAKPTSTKSFVSPTPSPSPRLPSGTSYIAKAAVPTVEVFARPNAAAARQRFANPWYINDNRNAPVPLVFHVEQVRTDGWLRVLLPVRPNSSTGWIRASDVTLTTTSFRIAVDLSAHRLTVYQGQKVIVKDTVAIGARATPTPTGRFYIRALLKSPNPNTTYGPYAYGLSGYSEVLQQFAGGDAEVGIHGNNNSSVLGKNVSHGCVRMSNDLITRLTKLLPLGTPVEIVR
ncbi:MAG: hypothetical protein QOG53_566 [Frankiales bacterium]|nr:hypothetical protein [Frankiales bacterium]